jgi:hypothetical protein
MIFAGHVATYEMVTVKVTATKPVSFKVQGLRELVEPKDVTD